MLKSIQNFLQFILVIVAIIGVFASITKVFFPRIGIDVISFYYTFDENKKGLVILKLKTASNVDLILDDVAIHATYKNGNSIKMIPVYVRRKLVWFVMPTIKNEEAYYKLLKPLEPDLRICGIKKGTNECYISLKSEEIFEDKPIKSWIFELKYSPYLLPVPNISFFNKKTIEVDQPKSKDLYFDDNLFKRATPEEMKKTMDEL